MIGLLSEEYGSVESKVTINIDYDHGQFILYGLQNEEEIMNGEIDQTIKDLEAALELTKLAKDKFKNQK